MTPFVFVLLSRLISSKEDGVVFNPDYPKPAAGSGEVLVKVKAAALNHRDVWITKGMYAGIKYPTILGSDGVGEVVAVGEGGDEALIGQDVILNPNVGWGDNPRHQLRSYSILGLPKDGTLAEYVVVGADRIRAKPEHLLIEQAAALPLHRVLESFIEVQVGDGIPEAIGSDVFVQDLTRPFLPCLVLAESVLAGDRE